MIDLPHEIQRLLAARAGAFLASAPGEARRDGIASIYAFGDVAMDDGFVLESATVCSPPLWFEAAGRRFTPNSGAHRVLLRGRHDGEPMLIAIEEREDLGCEYQGELLRVGVRSSRAGQDDPAFLAALIGSAIAAATGERPQLPLKREVVAGNARGQHERAIDRFQVHVLPLEALEAEGCALSPEARSCLLFLLPESIFSRRLEAGMLRVLMPTAMMLM